LTFFADFFFFGFGFFCFLADRTARFVARSFQGSFWLSVKLRQWLQPASPQTPHAYLINAGDRYDYDSTSTRRPFDGLPKVIKVTVT